VSRHVSRKDRRTSFECSVPIFEFNIAGYRDMRHLIKIDEKVF
jgi:hypothetical protein